MLRPPYVAVIGASQAGPELLSVAEEVGSRLADAGAFIVCGGRGGVMAAVCRGAHTRGGTTIGLLPGTDHDDANKWVTVAIPTGLGELRNGLVVRAGEAVIAVGGSYGTLSEIALALRGGTPVLGLGTWDIAGVERQASPRAAVARALELVRGRRDGDRAAT